MRGLNDVKILAEASCAVVYRPLGFVLQCDIALGFKREDRCGPQLQSIYKMSTVSWIFVSAVGSSHVGSQESNN